ncbi:hypothetical protein FGB62_146g03 [Gracilaria domingensis]|nr:hypothetical protein FGB62_146g03 [Gracilaria domingensis]
MALIGRTSSLSRSKAKSSAQTEPSWLVSSRMAEVFPSDPAATAPKRAADLPGISKSQQANVTRLVTAGQAAGAPSLLRLGCDKRRRDGEAVAAAGTQSCAGNFRAARAPKTTGMVDIALALIHVWLECRYRVMKSGGIEKRRRGRRNSHQSHPIAPHQAWPEEWAGTDSGPLGVIAMDAEVARRMFGASDRDGPP